MCANYTVKAKVEVFQKFYEIPIPADFEEMDFRVVPFAKAPVLGGEGRGRALRMMQFSLIPNWSEDRKPKFATFNARIEDIQSKPTWKEPFQKFHCVVPMTSFIEPIYSGEFAGHMVSFDSTEMLSAAGIYNSWVDRRTGEVIDSFALIMQEAFPFVAKVGHERSPIFLSQADSKEWLGNEGERPDALKTFLREKSFVPDLKVSVDRPMASGWQKRIPK
ncbi:MAG: SOS response-associated peptidase [Bdellovibrionales bacterium]|nr:SOS response-associated peptidase [Bdellovibrionales bacterium]